MGFIAKGLGDTTRRFKRTPVWASIVQWYNGCPLFKRTIIANISAALEMSASARAAVRITRKFDASKRVEERLGALEQAASSIQTQMDKESERLTRELDGVERRIQNAIKNYKDADEALQKKLEEQVADGIAEGYMGLVILLFGTLYSGLPKYVIDACFVQLLPGP